MRLTKMASQLLQINEDFRWRSNDDNRDVTIYDFDQIWGSTALGFPGCGGSAITTERTYVIIDGDTAYVYFGGNYAYQSPVTVALMDDVNNQRMASVMESGRYKK